MQGQLPFTQSAFAQSASLQFARTNSRTSIPLAPTCLDRWLLGEFTILPENNFLLDAWDMVVIAALLVTAVLLPFEVALVSTPSDLSQKASHVIDLVFTIDIILTFNVACVIEEKGAATCEVYERHPMKIARRYMAFPFSDNFQAGWFWPDVLTVLPWDLIARLGFFSGAVTEHVRLIRVLRLLRMLRLVRVVKLFKRWQIKSGFPFSAMRILTCASVTLLFCHWMACLWGHIGLHPGAHSTTWLANHLTATAGDTISSLTTHLTSMEVYQNSLYLLVVVLTSVGFGDITPSNEMEEVAMTITMFFTGITWAWVVGNVVAVITNMDIFGTIFNQVMDDLNSLMSAHGVTNSLKLRVRRHIHESYKIQKELHHHESIKWLSPGLQGELAMQSGVDKVATQIWYLRGLPEEIIIELADEFKGDLWSPGEVIMDHDSLSVIIRGSCIRKGIMYKRDDIFGEDLILKSEHLRDTSCPRTLTFLEVMKLHRDSLIKASRKFPILDAKLRRAQIKLAIWRSFVRTAEQIRVQQKRLGIRSSQKRRSTWDAKFFGNSNGSKEVVNAAVKLESWAASMTDSQEFASKESPTAKFEDISQQILEELADIKRSTQDTRTECELRWSAFDKRFTTVEMRLDDMAAQLMQMSAKQAEQVDRQPPSPTSPSSAKSMFSRKTSSR